MPLVLVAAYLAFLDGFALLVWAQRGRLVEDLKRHYGLSRDWVTQRGLRARFTCISATTPYLKLGAPSAVTEIVRPPYDWIPVPMKADMLWQDRWSLRLALPPGVYEYIFVIDGQHRVNTGDTKIDAMLRSDRVQNPFGTQNNRISFNLQRYYGSRVQLRNTLTQVLITVAGFVLAFAGKSGLPMMVGVPAITSILCGVIFHLAFAGGIIREATPPPTIEVNGLHENLMEILLNLQIAALIFSLATLAVSGHESGQPCGALPT